MVRRRLHSIVRFEYVFFLFILAILNIIAWVLLASAGVMVARYFDTVWPYYERRVVVDGSGVATEQTVPRRRQVPYFAVRYSLVSFVRIRAVLFFFHDRFYHQLCLSWLF